MSGSESLERFINRRRLFVRVQANVPRELFVQKLNAAFPGARIGVGNANAERGPVTQRVADVNYESAAEATQALRRNRFKLKVGNHDADITYQIERKDVVEKLAGEWGCRFMVVVKNLPPGDISCAELAEMFEAAGEIFTIKILPGNRGEPYALVQYVEEQSVDLSIQQLNQHKMHGAVLYVERHLKARRQNSSAQGPPAAVAPSSASSGGSAQGQHGHAAQSSHQQSQSASQSQASSGSTGGQARSAAAVVGASTPAPPSPQTQQQPVQQSLRQPGMTAAAVAAGTASATSQAAPSPPHPAPSPAAPQPAPVPTQPMPSPPSNSLFSQQYSIGGSTGSESGQYGSASDLLRQYSANSQPQAAPGAKPAAPSPIIGSAAAVVGGPSLRSSGGQGAVQGSTPTAASGTSNVLVPMLDLFSHLRGGSDQAPANNPGTVGAGSDMGNGLANGSAGYAGMLLRGGPSGAAPAAGTPSPGGPGAALGDVSSGLGGLLAPSSTPTGSLLSQQHQQQQQQHSQQAAAAQQQQQQQHAQQSLLGSANGPTGAPPAGPGAPGAAGPGGAGSHPQQHNAAAAAAAALGLTRISIRDALRLALGRLEELVTCPLTMEIMRDPVIAADGFTYERQAIQSWLATSDASPMTNEPLAHKALVTNKLAREIIADILP
mmetsp:Transcript_28785/g.73354  ORF Transcript_28785/g.73354 Transcript_28785/m.73354 type:complete len:662 (-) Transcript_28785:108-2093(-)